MITINTKTNEIYCSDAYTGEFDCTIGTKKYTSLDIKSGTIEIIEAISSNDSIQFSSTEKGCLKITLGNLNHAISDLNGQKITLAQIVNKESIPLGEYNITTSKNNGANFVDIEAYDNLELLDRDVSDWWNNTVTDTMTVRNMLISLLTYCGATYDIPSSFTNSSYVIVKNAVFENVTGLEVLGYIQEISACFFKPNRSGTFVKLALPTTTWSSLTPVHTYTIGETVKDLKVADYVTEEITKVQVRGTTNDVGIIVGSGDNAYIIESNPLLAGIEDNSTNRTMITNILNVVNKIQYIPFSGTFRGLPFIEVGDFIRVNTTSPTVYGYGVLTRRTLFSAGVRRDTIEIKGSEQHQTVTMTNRSVKVLNNRIHEVVNTVDEFRSTVTEEMEDMAGNIESNTTSIEQHSNELLLKAEKDVVDSLNDTVERNYSELKTTSETISTTVGKVSKNLQENYTQTSDMETYVSSKIEQSASKITTTFNTKIGELSTNDVSTWITEDPNGITIRKSNAGMASNFSNDALTFYSGSTEVAWLRGDKEELGVSRLAIGSSKANNNRWNIVASGTNNRYLTFTKRSS